MDCSLLGSSVHAMSQARILEWIAIFLLQGIFLIQGWNPRLLQLLNWQADSLALSHQGSPIPSLQMSKLRLNEVKKESLPVVMNL